jgi:hypothetical protein
MLRKLGIALAALITLALIFVGLLVASLNSEKEDGMKAAASFCHAAMGMSRSALVRLAQSQVPPQEPIEKGPVLHYFFPTTMFEAVRCTLTLENEKVVGAKVDYLHD